MTYDLPYALGCPECPYYVEVSEVDPDASLSELHGHILGGHAAHSFEIADQMLAKARELTEAEAAR
jgi:hypothetical protein